MESTTSFTSGCAERMKLSEQQVHSRPCIQMTGTRSLVSSACAIVVAAVGPRPRLAAVRLQNFVKLRRVIPWRRMTS